MKMLSFLLLQFRILEYARGLCLNTGEVGDVRIMVDCCRCASFLLLLRPGVVWQRFKDVLIGHCTSTECNGIGVNLLTPVSAPPPSPSLVVPQSVAAAPGAAPNLSHVRVRSSHAARQIPGTPMAVDAGGAGGPVQNGVAPGALEHDLPVVGDAANVGPVVVHPHVAYQQHPAMLDRTRERAVDCSSVTGFEDSGAWLG